MFWVGFVVCLLSLGEVVLLVMFFFDFDFVWFITLLGCLCLFFVGCLLCVDWAWFCLVDLDAWVGGFV